MILIASFISHCLQFAISETSAMKIQFRPVFTSHAELPGRDKVATIIHACQSGEPARRQEGKAVQALRHAHKDDDRFGLIRDGVQ